MIQTGLPPTTPTRSQTNIDESSLAASSYLPPSGGLPPMSSSGGLPPVSGGLPPMSSSGRLPPVSGGLPPVSGGLPPMTPPVTPSNTSYLDDPAVQRCREGEYTPLNFCEPNWWKCWLRMCPDLNRLPQTDLLNQISRFDIPRTLAIKYSFKFFTPITWLQPRSISQNRNLGLDEVSEQDINDIYYIPVIWYLRQRRLKEEKYRQAGTLEQYREYYQKEDEKIVIPDSTLVVAKYMVEITINNDSEHLEDFVDKLNRDERLHSLSGLRNNCPVISASIDAHIQREFISNRSVSISPDIIEGYLIPDEERSPIIISGMNLESDVLYKGSPVDDTNAIILFDDFEPNNKVPFARINIIDPNTRLAMRPTTRNGEKIRVISYNMKNITKAYKGTIIGPKLKWVNIVPALTEIDYPQTLFWIVWLGNAKSFKASKASRENDPSKATKESYSVIALDLETSKISVNINFKKHHSYKTAMAIINDYIRLTIKPNPTSDIVHLKMKNIKARVNFYGVLYDQFSFAHFIEMGGIHGDEIETVWIKQYVYLLESSRSVSEKNSHDYYFRDLLKDEIKSTRFSIKQLYSETQNYLCTQNATGKRIILLEEFKSTQSRPINEPYVEILIKNAQTERSLSKFVDILSAIFKVYQSKVDIESQGAEEIIIRDKIIELYSNYFPYTMESYPNNQGQYNTTYTSLMSNICNSSGKGSKQEIERIKILYTYDELAPLFQAVHSKDMTRSTIKLKDYLNPDWSPIFPLTRSIKEELEYLAAGTKSNMAKLSAMGRLKRLAPEYTNISRKGGKNKPRILYPDEVEIWSQAGWDVLGLPLENPKHFFTALIASHRYMGVKTAHGYPDNIIPKSYMAYDKSRKKSQETQQVDQQNIVRRRGVNTKFKTRKILTSESRGFLPLIIQNILMIQSDNQYGIFERQGVPGNSFSSKNSAIHCLMTALLKHPETLADRVPILHSDHQSLMNHRGEIMQLLTQYNVVNEYVREQIVANIRKNIFPQIVNPGLLRQELFDHTEQEIMDLLTDNDIFFDPALFYRALEEVFNVNVCVFSYPSREAANEEKSTVDIPRHRGFHVAYVNEDRRTVFIIKNSGAEADNADHAQCELIIHNDSHDRYTKVFTGGLTELSSILKRKTNSTYTWSYTNINSNPQIVTRLDMYNIILTDSMFSSASFQYIDIYGKLRALVVGNNEITVVLPPSAPVNLPTIHKLILTDWAKVIENFKEPIAVSINISNDQKYVTGMWYPYLDLTYGIYVPINHILYNSLDKSYPIGITNPLPEHSINQSQRIGQMLRLSSITQQLFQWIFRIFRQMYRTYGLDRHEVRDHPDIVDIFMDRLTVTVSDKNELQSIIGDDNLDPLNIYHFQITNHYLPTTLNITKAWDYLKTLNSKIIIERNGPDNNKMGAFLIYPPELREKIRYSLLTFHRDTALNPMPAKPMIRDLYQNADDFKQSNRTNIFMSNEELSTWFYDLARIRADPHLVIDKITYIHMMAQEPFIFANGIQKYIFQNVYQGNYYRAKNVARVWYQKKTNLGYDAPEADNQLPFMLFTISPGSTIIAIDDFTQGASNFLHILEYDPDNVSIKQNIVDNRQVKERHRSYAALLPL